MVGTVTSGLHLGSPIQRCCKTPWSNTKDDFQLSRKALNPMQADEAKYPSGAILGLFRIMEKSMEPTISYWNVCVELSPHLGVDLQGLQKVRVLLGIPSGDGLQVKRAVLGNPRSDKRHRFRV